MHRNASRPLALFAAVLLTIGVAHAKDPLPRAKPEAVGMSTERLARLTPVMKSYVDDKRLAGSVVLVARKGKLVYFEAFGQRDREANAPMQTDSIFRIASQTKAVVTTGAMLLVEQGKLSLSDPVAKYIPEFAETRVAVAREGGRGYDIITARRQITVRDLMTHTSGLSYGNGPAAAEWAKAGITGYYFADRDEPIGATVARMAKLPFDAQPGERWIYGYSIDVLGVVVEKASGMPLDEFMRRNVTTPLGMNDTSFYLPPEKRDRFAAVYGVNAAGAIERTPAPGGANGQGAYVDGPRKAFSAGAGFLSTAGDYARFLQMLLDRGESGGQRLLSRKTVELMTSDNLRIPYQPGVGFGLSFYVVKDLGARGDPGSVGEIGWGGAYHSTYWMDPKEQLVVVYLTQLSPAGEIDDFNRLRALVYQSIVD